MIPDVALKNPEHFEIKREIIGKFHRCSDIHDSAVSPILSFKIRSDYSGACCGIGPENAKLGKPGCKLERSAIRLDASTLHPVSYDFRLPGSQPEPKLE